MRLLCSYEPMDDIVRGMPFPDNFDDLAVMQGFVPLGTSTPDIARSVSLTLRDLPNSPCLQDNSAAGQGCTRHASLLRCHHMQMCAGQYCWCCCWAAQAAVGWPSTRGMLQPALLPAKQRGSPGRVPSS